MDSYKLPVHQRFSYGVGHILNDLCASMWFSYLLVFLHYVVRFSNALAGNLMLLGQVADAIATPLVGLESDRTDGFCGYGKRKSWHLFGTICVMVSFPFLFMLCLGCEYSADWAKFIYYAPFVVIFQIGWAATQISHLSLIPSLTPNTNEKVELNAIRYAFTVISNITVYGITWLMLDMHMKNHASDDVTTADAPRFRILGLAVLGIGAVFSFIFHVGTKEKNISVPHINNLSIKPACHMTWKDWLKEHQFYQVALLYMSTRLIVNISQVYLPMYLTDTLQLNKRFIAITPLVVFVSGFVASFVMKPLNTLVGRKVTYLVGIVCIVGNCVWLYLLQVDHNLWVLGAAILQGVGGSTLLVTSLSMTADLIGCHTESSAFVYGAMSFTDKLSNGIAVALIQHLHPCKTISCCPACTWYYRDVISFIPGGCVILAFILLLTLAPVSIGRLRRHITEEELNSEIPSVSVGDSDTCCNYLTCFRSSTDALSKGVTPHTEKTEILHVLPPCVTSGDQRTAYPTVNNYESIS